MPTAMEDAADGSELTRLGSPSGGAAAAYGKVACVAVDSFARTRRGTPEGQVSLRGCPGLRSRPEARAPERNAPPHMREVSLGVLERSPSNALARGCNMIMIKLLQSRTGNGELSHRGIANIRARSAISRSASPPIHGQAPLQQTGYSR